VTPVTGRTTAEKLATVEHEIAKREVGRVGDKLLPALRQLREDLARQLEAE